MPTPSNRRLVIFLNSAAYPFLLGAVLLILAGTSRLGRAQDVVRKTGANKYFHIQVVDQQTGRGVPLAELRTVNDIRLYTDSAGNIAFYESDLMDQEVFFHVSSHGYEYPKDGFGYRGVRLKTKPGTRAIVKLKRNNVARRLYRITGSGIYRDTRLLGLKPPIAIDDLNSKVLGCDSVINAIYKNQLYWFWGDTNRVAYPLGNFQVTGATSKLPADIDASKGFTLDYFKNKNGFAKSMAPIPGPGPTWIFGAFTTRKKNGEQVLIAKYEKIKPPMVAYQRGLVAFDDQQQKFSKLVEFDLGAPVYPQGQTLSRTVNKVNYLYFAKPFPLTRVVNDFDKIQDPKEYEAFTYLKTGTILAADPKKRILDDDMLDRDRNGKLISKWRKNTQPISPKLEQELIKRKLIRPNESLAILGASRPELNGEKKEVILSSGSVAWNEYRQKWIMIGVQVWGTSMLGEIWFAEAENLTGPWSNATKVVSHDSYSFYNPRHHPYFDQKGDQVIYFEGTYTSMFSGAKSKTPRYDYNQIMYQLDLADIPPTD